MKTIILIIIAGVCLFLFIMSSVYGDDSVDLTDEQAENIRQQLNELPFLFRHFSAPRTVFPE